MENLYLIACAVVLVGAVVAFAMGKFKERKGALTFKKLLHELVIEAEEFYGSKKGQEKFAYAYNHLVIFFPYARFIPKTLISKMIDKILKKLESELRK